MRDQDPPSTEHWPQFLTQLWETGRVRVPDLGLTHIPKAEREPGWARLQQLARSDRKNLPGTPPQLARPAAEWAAVMTYRACSFLVHRSHAAHDMQKALSLPCPQSPNPDSCYSVDLTFRFLPDLHRMAVAISPSDPLTKIVTDWARDWPLSSVGIDFSAADSENLPDPDQKNLAATSPAPDKSKLRPRDTSPALNLDPFWNDDCLQRLYIDRVLDRGDKSRLSDPRVAEAIRAVLGNHPELSAKMAAAVGQGGNSS